MPRPRHAQNTPKRPKTAPLVEEGGFQEVGQAIFRAPNPSLGQTSFNDGGPWSVPVAVTSDVLTTLLLTEEQADLRHTLFT